MPVYDFQCDECKHFQEIMILWSQLEPILVEAEDKWGYINVDEYECEKCGCHKLHKVMINAPTTIGDDQYMSLEKYWSKNPELAKQKEREIREDYERRIKRVKDKVDQQSSDGKNRQNRHKDYGRGQGETQLNLE